MVAAFGFVGSNFASHPTSTSLHSSATKNECQTTSTPMQLISAEKRTEIEKMVRERSEARWHGDYKRADQLRDVIDQICVTIPLNELLQKSIERESDFLEYKVVTADLPRSQGGGSTWELQLVNNPLFSNEKTQDNVLQLAHAVLGMVVSASNRGVDVDEFELNALVSRVEARLQSLKKLKAMSTLFPGTGVAGELHGRKAADAAFWLSLAGVNNAHDNFNIYDELAEISTDELLRFGSKNSCRPKDVLHIVERFGMAGAVGSNIRHLYSVAADCLEGKMMNNIIDTSQDGDDSSIDYIHIINSLRGSSFGLHSDRSLLGLWRFSIRQRKQRVFFENAAKHFDGRFRVDTASQSIGDRNLEQYEWEKLFNDPTRPLVVDVGCGMGVSLVGLASGTAAEATTEEEIQIDWNECNFIGVDLSRLAIRFAKGVSKRWKLDHLRFIVDPAEKCIERLKSYPGPVKLAMIQFPTPYRYTEIDEDSESSVVKGYNAQLPEDSEAGCFMVTEKLLCLIQEILSRGEESGMLLVQSNCEDVAVRMKSIAETRAGFDSVEFANSRASLDAVTQRAQRWVANGGNRAIGTSFSSLPLLPKRGRTETEVACSLDDKPVHRCLFIPRSQQNKIQ